MTEENPTIQNASEIIRESEEVHERLEELADEAERRDVVVQATADTMPSDGEPPHQFDVYLRATQIPYRMKEWIDENGLRVYDAHYFEQDGEDRLAVTLVFEPRDTFARICELMRERGLSATEALAVHARDDRYIPLNRLEQDEGVYATGRGGARMAYSRAQSNSDV